MSTEISTTNHTHQYKDWDLYNQSHTSIQRPRSLQPITRISTKTGVSIANHTHQYKDRDLSNQSQASIQRLIFQLCQSVTHQISRVDATTSSETFTETTVWLQIDRKNGSLNVHFNDIARFYFEIRFTFQWWEVADTVVDGNACRKRNACQVDRKTHHYRYISHKLIVKSNTPMTELR